MDHGHPLAARAAVGRRRRRHRCAVPEGPEQVRGLRPRLRAAAGAGGEVLRVRARREPARRRPVALEPRADPPQPHGQVAAQGHRRDRGPAVLGARPRGRLRGDRSRRRRQRARAARRPGRVDDPAAARARPLPAQSPARHRAQAHGGVPGDRARPQDVEARDPDDVHERGVLREQRLRRRGRGADVLLAPGAAVGARAGGDDRRPAAGAVAVRSGAPSGGGEAPAQPGAGRDAGRRRDHAAPVRGRAASSAAPDAAPGATAASATRRSSRPPGASSSIATGCAAPAAAACA